MIDDIKKAEHSLSIFSIRQFFPSSGYGLGAFFIYSWREGIFRLVYGGASTMSFALRQRVQISNLFETEVRLKLDAKKNFAEWQSRNNMVMLFGEIVSILSHDYYMVKVDGTSKPLKWHEFSLIKDFDC